MGYYKKLTTYPKEIMNLIFILVITILTIMFVLMSIAVAQLDLKLKTANKSVKTLTAKVKDQNLLLDVAIELLNTDDINKQNEIMDQFIIDKKFKKITLQF
jgi:hypothetical protein